MDRRGFFAILLSPLLAPLAISRPKVLGTFSGVFSFGAPCAGWMRSDYSPFKVVLDERLGPGEAYRDGHTLVLDSHREYELYGDPVDCGGGSWSFLRCVTSTSLTR